MLIDCSLKIIDMFAFTVYLHKILSINANKFLSKRESAEFSEIFFHRNQNL
jgi:hypothetical protein